MANQVLRVGLISCAKEKGDRLVPAGSMYRGDYFAKQKTYAVATYDRWAILSAKHGVLMPSTVISPYDVTLNNMPAADRKAWAQKVADALNTSYPYPEDVELYIHAGRRYREYLIPLLEAKGYVVKVPLQGVGGIGMQKKWYAERGF